MASWNVTAPKEGDEERYLGRRQKWKAGGELSVRRAPLQV
jgi:hypothetical protein